MIAFAYIRVSGDEQADRGLPVHGQRQEIERYCAAHQVQLARLFIDEARPGSTDHRAQFQLMMRLAHADPAPCDVILLWSWSRFARSQDDAHYWKASLRRHGVQIQDISGETPPADGYEYVIESLIHWKDEQRLKEISLDSRRGQQALARAGFIPSGGPPPAGYTVAFEEKEIEGRKRRLRRWVPDPIKWPLARLAWDMRLQGRSYTDIWRATNLYRNPEGYNAMFTNRAYTGAVSFGGTPVPVEALITQAEWDQVNANRHTRASGAYSRRQGSRFLLSGLLICNRCGAAVDGSRSVGVLRNDGYTRTPWDYYICIRRRHHACDLPRIGARDLEAAIINALFDHILTEDNLAAQADAINAQRDRDRPSLTARLDELRDSLAALDRAINRLIDAIEASPNSGALTDRLSQREQERLDLQSQLRHIDGQLANPPPDPAALTDLRARLRAALADPARIQDARLLLRHLIEQILLDEHTLRITYAPFF